MTTFLPHLFVLCLFITYNEYLVVCSSCVYSRGIKSGSCSGIIESSISLRNDFSFLNKGCPINNVFYYPSASANPICAECIPTSLLYSNRILNYKITVCKQTTIGRVCGQPQDSLINDYQCSIGDYCSEEGACKPLESHPLVGESCSDIQHPISSQIASQ